MLTGPEHIAEARECLQISQRLIAAGQRRIASDVLWLAVKHAISAIGIASGQPYGKYQHKRAIVRQLDAARGSETLYQALKIALRIHADADQGFFTPAELTQWQQVTSDFARHLLTTAATITRTPEQPN